MMLVHPSVNLYLFKISFRFLLLKNYFHKAWYVYLVNEILFPNCSWLSYIITFLSQEHAYTQGIILKNSTWFCWVMSQKKKQPWIHALKVLEWCVSGWTVTFFNGKSTGIVFILDYKWICCVKGSIHTLKQSIAWKVKSRNIWDKNLKEISLIARCNKLLNKTQQVTIIT